MRNPFSTNRPQSLYAALILLSVAMLFGGASRYEVGTTIVARMTALGVLVYIFWRRHGSSLRIGRSELIFWIALFALPLIQLIPLPWSTWTALPGRGLARDVFVALGDTPWMTISLSPSRTLDFLLALFVPFTAYLVGTHLDFPARAVLLRTMLVFALVDAVLGLVQLSTGPQGGFYLYSITNDDSSVGLFSNSNHLGLFLSGSIVIALAWLGDSMTVSGRIIAPAAIACGLAICVLLFGIAGTASRAAAVFSVIAIVGGLLMLPLERIGLSKRYVFGGSAVVALLLAAGLGLLLSGRVMSDRFQIDNAADRLSLIPQYVQAARDFFPFGSGLGSFEPVFKSYEKASQLNFGYWNQAHEDYLQVAIEAGLAGVALIVAFLLWYVVRVIGIFRGGDESSRVRRQQVTAALFLLLVLLHSIIDYPMRTAAMACVVGFLAAFLAAPEKNEPRRQVGRGDFGEDAFRLYERNPDVVPAGAVDRGIAAQGGDHYS